MREDVNLPTASCLEFILELPKGIEIPRERGAVRAELSRQPLGVRESHPEALVRSWTRRFGAERAAELCRWNNGRPTLTLRVRAPGLTVAVYLDRLRAAGLQGEPHPYAPDAFVHP